MVLVHIKALQSVYLDRCLISGFLAKFAMELMIIAQRFIAGGIKTIEICKSHRDE
jgi:hypothetical protein